MSPGVPRWRAGPGQTACLTCGERIVVAPSSVRAYRDHAGIITLVAYCAGRAASAWVDIVRGASARQRPVRRSMLAWRLEQARLRRSQRARPDQCAAAGRACQGQAIGDAVSRDRGWPSLVRAGPAVRPPRWPWPATISWPGHLRPRPGRLAADAGYPENIIGNGDARIGWARRRGPVARKNTIGPGARADARGPAPRIAAPAAPCDKCCCRPRGPAARSASGRTARGSGNRTGWPQFTGAGAAARTRPSRT
jgi:hypothetical protein